MIGWARRGPTCWMNPAGYFISASMLRGIHHYSAWAPEAAKDEHDRRLLWKYTHGTRVPQRRELLGVFTNPQAARDACDRHHEVSHGTTADAGTDGGQLDLLGHRSAAQTAP